MSPNIMLFDEPTSSLDPELAHEDFDTIQALARSHMTLVLINLNFHCIFMLIRVRFILILRIIYRKPI